MYTDFFADLLLFKNFSGFTNQYSTLTILKKHLETLIIFKSLTNSLFVMYILSVKKKQR